MNKTSNFNFVTIKSISKKELAACFQIIKNNLPSEGIILQPGDEKLWKDNFVSNVDKDNFITVLIYRHGSVCGFFTLLMEEKLYLCEIQFDESVKNTRLILETLLFLFNLDKISNYEKIYFNIKRSNFISNKTFSHLGGQVVSTATGSLQYVLDRSTVQSYLNRLKFSTIDSEQV